MNDPFDLFMDEVGKKDCFARFASPADNSSSEPVPSVDDLIFDYFKTEENEVSVPKFLATLRNSGLQRNDPRLQKMIESLQLAINERLQLNDAVKSRDLLLDRETFKKCIYDDVRLIITALRHQFVISDWDEFCQQVEQIYKMCAGLTQGKTADYIPALKRASHCSWGVSVCTIDGQRMAWGDFNVPWSIQSISKPLTYGIALHENGADYVHSYVGHEPSGRLFNEICLDHNGKPHNPMINAGAVVVDSLIKGDLPLADRFDFIRRKYKDLAGGEFLGYSITTFQSELESADKNSALAFYLKDNKCFPKDVNLKQTLELYFQQCSIEVTCESAAVIAATLANGGTCPLTDAKVLNNQSVRDMLSLMYSCGMYDYSGQFAYQVGLPAKSGVSGGLILVIPNILGFALWSPPLDTSGNTVRGVAFCRQLVETFNFRNFDNLLHSESHKIDPCKRLPESHEQQLVNMFFAVAAGDLNSVKRYASHGFSMDATNYDRRSALHIAAAEGHIEILEYLLRTCQVIPNARDRWNRTPLDDAKLFGHEECVEKIESYKREITHIDISHTDDSGKKKPTAKKPDNKSW